MKTLICGLCATLLMVAPALAETSEVIGQIRTLKGSALVERSDIVLPAAVGMALHRGDLIRTGTPGAAGIVLTDETTVSLGSGSELAMKDYAFDPREGRFASVMRIDEGEPGLHLRHDRQTGAANHPGTDAGRGDRGARNQAARRGEGVAMETGIRRYVKTRHGGRVHRLRAVVPRWLRGPADRGSGAGSRWLTLVRSRWRRLGESRC